MLREPEKDRGVTALPGNRSSSKINDIKLPSVAGQEAVIQKADLRDGLSLDKADWYSRSDRVFEGTFSGILQDPSKRSSSGCVARVRLGS